MTSFHFVDTVPPLRPHRLAQRIAWLLVLSLLLAACQSAETPTTPEASPQAGTPQVVANQTPGALPTGVVEVDPLPPDQATAPVRLQIPSAGLDVPVTPMGWEVVTINNQRTTTWVVPDDAAGWHVNSAGAGALGNTIISGKQNGGDAVFAPLAVGRVNAGDEVHLVDSDGLIFVYRIREVTQPIPIAGASTEDVQQALSYMAQTETAQLTLITGWPDFTTTHRIFALCNFVGVLR
jgi:sortase (surface protein transpeptidase)